MTNSCRKGKAGEREAAHELARVLGIDARRGQQFSGSPESPDVVTSLSGVHWEVKRVERLQIVKALDQAIADAGQDVPAVLHRPNGCAWMVTVRLDDLPRLARCVVWGFNP